MSQHLNPPHFMQQLSVGNVVNVTLSLYRANFKLYLKLSLLAYLWLLVPLYQDFRSQMLTLVPR